jgi:hypothetical protein
MLNDVRQEHLVELAPDCRLSVAGGSSHELHIQRARPTVFRERYRLQCFANDPYPVDAHMFEEPSVLQNQDASFEEADLFGKQ